MLARERKKFTTANKLSNNLKVKTEIRIESSVPDLWHFGKDPDADPDPRIRISD